MRLAIAAVVLVTVGGFASVVAAGAAYTVWGLNQGAERPSIAAIVVFYAAFVGSLGYFLVRPAPLFMPDWTLRKMGVLMALLLVGSAVALFFVSLFSGIAAST